MPRKDNRVTCVNGHGLMPQNEGFNAVTRVQKQGDNVTFNPSNGVPVKVFYCKTCGYIEMYAASLVDADWQQA